MTTCAYPQCQAGGVILPGAPRVERIRPCTQFYAEPWHPGCWAAQCHEHRANGARR